MIGLVIFVLILPVQVFAAGEDSSSENSRTEDNMTETDLEKTQEETEQKIWELTEIKNAVEELEEKGVSHDEAAMQAFYALQRS